jgi:hypothetical protein
MGLPDQAHGVEDGRLPDAELGNLGPCRCNISHAVA